MTDKIYPIGRVYKLISDNGLCYIGSTNRTLSRRLSDHKSDYKRFKDNKKRYISSFKLFEDKGIINIDLLEEHANISKYDLQVRERFYIENNECVNKAIPTQTKKEWIEKNKDKRTAYKTKQKEHYEANKEKIIAKRKEHYEANKEKIYTQKAERILCDRCKCETSRGNKSIHQKSQKCINITNIFNITTDTNVINNKS